MHQKQVILPHYLRFWTFKLKGIWITDDDINDYLYACFNKFSCISSAVKLGEECLADEACLKVDANSDCVQGNKLKAICECKPNFHQIHDKSIGMLRCVPGTGKN